MADHDEVTLASGRTMTMRRPTAGDLAIAQGHLIDIMAERSPDQMAALAKLEDMDPRAPTHEQIAAIRATGLSGLDRIQQEKIQQEMICRLCLDPRMLPIDTRPMHEQAADPQVIPEGWQLYDLTPAEQEEIGNWVNEQIQDGATEKKRSDGKALSSSTRWPKPTGVTRQGG